MPCRHLKKLCDGKSPCSSCKLRGRECVYRNNIWRGSHREGSVRRISGCPQPAIFNGVFGHIYQLDAPSAVCAPPSVYRPETSTSLPPPPLLHTGTGGNSRTGHNHPRSDVSQMMLDAGASSGGGNGDRFHDVVTDQVISQAGVAKGRKMRNNISDACAACRKSKVKCDEIKPCTRCIKNSQMCLNWRNEMPHPGDTWIVMLLLRYAHQANAWLLVHASFCKTDGTRMTWRDVLQLLRQRRAKLLSTLFLHPARKLLAFQC